MKIVPKIVMASFIAFLGYGSAKAASIGGWEVRPAYDDGKLSSCAMWGEFNGGMTLGVLVKSDYSWAFAFGHKAWQLTKDQAFVATVSVDNLNIGDGRAHAYSETGGVLKLVPGAYEILQRGHAIRISALGMASTLSLKGSQRALQAVLDCVRKNSSQATRQTTSSDDGSGIPVPGVEAVTMLSNLLSTLGYAGYTIDQPKDDIIHWTFSDGSRGHFFAFRNFAGSTDQAVAAFISQTAEGCAGDFASAKHATPTTDGTEIRSLITSCRDQRGTRTLRTSIVKRGDTILTFSFPADADTPGESTFDKDLAQKAVITLPR